MSNIELVNASCVDQNVDAIVNASNKYLYPGDGVCEAIYTKAGYDLLNDACRSIKTPLNDGEAVITSAFNIKNAKYIIHAIGPNFGINPNAFDILFKTYYNSLILLKENNLHSISFPLISSGIYGGNLPNPAKESAKQCLKAYNRFIKDYDYDIKVILCAYTNKEYQEAQEIFTSMEGLYDR